MHQLQFVCTSSRTENYVDTYKKAYYESLSPVPYAPESKCSVFIHFNEAREVLEVSLGK